MSKAITPQHRQFLASLSLGLLAGITQVGLTGTAAAAPPTPIDPAANSAHVATYFTALANKDQTGIAPHFATDIVLRGPIFAEPTHGRAGVAQVLAGFIDTIDQLEVKSTFASGRDVAVFFRFSVNGITVAGNEHLHLNEHGLIDSIDVAWRPLAAAVAVQEIMAKRMGFAPMHLVQENAPSAPH